MKNKKKLIYIIASILVVLFVVAFDQITKLVISKNMELHESIKVIPNFFYIEYVTNDGAAWGMFAGNNFVILVIPFIAIVLFLYLLSKGNFTDKKVYSFSLMIILGGTIGNYIDRIRLSHVVDFLSFRFGSYHYPNFNVADSALVIGVILLAIDLIILDRLRTKKVEEIDAL